MKLLDLNGTDWTLTPTGNVNEVPQAVKNAGAIRATVPGCAHTDLMAAGLLADPYVADNELTQFWVGKTDWRYVRSFDVDAALLAHERVDLACDGLDTVATVSVNGVEVGRSENMHVAQRFDIRKQLRAGRNEIAITFAAPVPYAYEQEKRYPGLPRNGGVPNKVYPHNLMRKMGCNFGWDWGPEVPTSGIWRPIRIEAWDKARIDQVRPLVTEATTDRATVSIHVDAETTGGAPSFSATLSGPDGFVANASGASPLTITVPNPKLWWPAGHGEQPLYELTVTCNDQTWSRRIGLRTTRLVTSADPSPVGGPIPDKQGEQMTLLVNEKPVYCKGANWIPDDCFPYRVTPERFRTRIEQAKAANMNMLRVWGGGLFEDRASYEICDELGVMIWQDFLFACACYPEEEPYRSLVEAEARHNVARLSAHPSVVIYNGCNENIWASFDWGPKWRAVREEGKRTWGLGYYLDLLPRVIGEVDPTRPYWPASPYSGSMDRHPNLNEYGNRHMWDVWHGAGQYRNYLGHYPRMATEFGYHGPATWPTIEQSIPPEERQWDSAQMLLHNKNGRNGQIQTNERMADDFVPPTHDYDAWHYLAQVMQARALSMGIEWFRALHPWNAGALYWQLNDCYPVSSWSAIDMDTNGVGRLKPLWYASRRFFAPRLVTIKPQRVCTPETCNDKLAVYLHNDTDQRWAGTLRLRQVTARGEGIGEASFPVDVAPRTVARTLVPTAMHGRSDAALVAEVDDLRGWWWFAPDKQITYAPASFESQVTRKGDVTHVSVRAKTLLRELCLFADRLDPDAQVNEQLVTLLPGESFTFEVRSKRELPDGALLAPPVLRCVNAFGRAG